MTERRIESQEFIESISGPWSKFFGKQAKEWAVQVGVSSEQGNFDDSEQYLQQVRAINEKGVGVQRFWGRVIEMMVDEGLTEIPSEVFDAFIERWRPAADKAPIEIKTSPVVTAEPEKPGSRKDLKDLTEIQEGIVYATYGINRELGDYQNPLRKDILAAVAQVDGIKDPAVRKIRLHRAEVNVSGNRQSIVSKLTAGIDQLDNKPEEVLPKTRTTVNWLLEIPEYAGIPKERLAEVLKGVGERRISYQDLIRIGIKEIGATEEVKREDVLEGQPEFSPSEPAGLRFKKLTPEEIRDLRIR